MLDPGLVYPGLILWSDRGGKAHPRSTRAPTRREPKLDRLLVDGERSNIVFGSLLTPRRASCCGTSNPTTAGPTVFVDPSAAPSGEVAPKIIWTLRSAHQQLLHERA